MPRFRKRKRFTRKRRNVRRKRPRFRKRRRKRTLSRIPRNIIPIKMFRKLVYQTSISLNPSAFTVVGYSFRCNSIFDPDFTGTGHQPMGHDQIALLYHKYKVVASSISITPVGVIHTASQTGGIYGCTTVMNSAQGISTDVDTNMERQRTSYRILPSGGQNTTGKAQSKVKQFFNARKMLSTKEYVDSSVPLSSNPPADSQVLYTVWYGGSDSSVDPAPAEFRITLYYWCLFTDPRLMVGS